MLKEEPNKFQHRCGYQVKTRKKGVHLIYTSSARDHKITGIQYPKTVELKNNTD
jgi:hypothetical protein